MITYTNDVQAIQVEKIIFHGFKDKTAYFEFFEASSSHLEILEIKTIADYIDMIFDEPKESLLEYDTVLIIGQHTYCLSPVDKVIFDTRLAAFSIDVELGIKEDPYGSNLLASQSRDKPWTN